MAVCRKCGSKIVIISNSVASSSYCPRCSRKGMHWTRGNKWGLSTEQLREWNYVKNLSKRYNIPVKRSSSKALRYSNTVYLGKSKNSTYLGSDDQDNSVAQMRQMVYFKTGKAPPLPKSWK